MNATSSPSRVLITGASGGIGGALAKHYASPGRSLLLHGRDAHRLQAVAKTCEAAGAEVQILIHELDRDHLAAWRELAAGLGPLDLVIVNAGVTSNTGDGSGEAWQQVERLLDVNLHAAVATVDAVLPAMRARGRGQLALISSLSAWYGLPATPAYCASKAALKAYGEALRGWLEAEGVAVNVVLPGFVASEMSAGFPGPKPFLWSADRAARRIARGLARNRARIAFPTALSLGMWSLAVLPAAWSQHILQWLGYGRR